MTTEIGNHATGYLMTVNADGSLTFGERALIQKISYNAQGFAQYIGKAVPGTATSDSGWQIQLLEYTGTNVVSITYASGTANFDKVWDDRATYAYS